MVNPSFKFRRLILILTLCLSLITLVTSVLAFTENFSDNTAVNLPLVIGGSGSSSGGSLEDGGIVIGVDGLTIGTVTGTLGSPIEVTITQVDPPPEPMFSGAVPHGNYYKIQAVEDAYTPVDKPFILGLPVPTGVPTANLAIAVLVPAEHILDNDSLNDQWFPTTGVYDASQELFIVTIAGLKSDGYTYVLVEHPDLGPIQPVSPKVINGTASAATFRVQCIGFNSSSDCGPALEAAVAGELVAAYNDFQTGLGFKDPNLKNQFAGLNPNWLLKWEYLDIYIVPISDDGCSIEGKYIPGTLMEICVNPGSVFNPAIAEAVRHEYFHATQYAYDNILTKPKDAWVMDGTATAAQKSVGTMMRSNDYDLHPVDVSLTDETDLYHYSAQDFWVLLGLELGQPLNYLIPLFDKGAQTKDVMDVFGDGDYLHAQWRWAKNHVMDKVPDYNGVLQNPCQYESIVVDQLQIYEQHWQDNPFHDVVVGPLNSVVVKIEFGHHFDLADANVIVPDPGQLPDANLALEFKFYVQGEFGCKSLPDRGRFFPEPGVDPGTDYYVVISNTDYDATYNYRIVFELSPIPPI